MTLFTSCYPHHAFLWLFWPTIQRELGNNWMFGDNLWDSWWLAGYKNRPWKRLGYINLSLPWLQPLDNLSSSSLRSATKLWKILLNCQHVNYFYIYAFSFWICLSHERVTLPLSFSILAQSGTPSWTAPSTTTHYGTRCQELSTSDSATFPFSSLWSNSNPSTNHHDPPSNPSSHNKSQLCECHALIDISSTRTGEDQTGRWPFNDRPPSPSYGEMVGCN